jgi:hypothetical protein
MTKDNRASVRLRLAAAAAVALAVALAAPVAWAAAVQGTVLFTVNLGQAATGALSPYTIPAQVQLSTNYASGVGPGQVDTLYARSLVLAGAPVTVDFAAVNDVSGAPVSFARIREFVAYVTDPAATHVVNVYAGASNGWSVVPPSTSPLPARPGGGLVRVADPQSTGAGAGNVVTATSRTVTFDPGANTVTVYVMAAGCSAP